MIDGLKPYPAMKDSGVPWLGDVPGHWRMGRMKTVLRERIQKGFPDEPLLAATQTKGVVRKEQYENRTVLALKDLHLLKLVRVGDFVISLRSFQGGIEYAREQGIISPAYTVLYPSNQGAHGYLAWLFKSKPYIENLTLFVTGIRQGQNIDYQKLSRSELPLPSPSEQATIVRFLDHADRRIRRYIRAKQKLIKLLEEQKQAIIHRAVTRGLPAEASAKAGLDPNARLNSSSVEWVGDLPEQWEMKRLKQVATIQTGITLRKTYRDLTLVERPYLRVANVQTGRLDLTKITSVRVPVAEAEGATLQAGDVLMTEGGDIDKLGRGCVWQDEIPGCLHQNHIFAVRPAPSMLRPQFLVAVMGSPHGRRYFQLTAKQTTNLAATNSTTLGNFTLRLPSVREQQQILEGIGEKTEKLDRATDRANREISLLREYRTRLIADVVTGKLDVRAAAASLPVEVDQPDTLDNTETLVEGDKDPATDDPNAVPDEAEA